MNYPRKILHWIQNEEVPPASGQFFAKQNPATGELLTEVSRGNQLDIEAAIKSATKAFDGWSSISVRERANILKKAAVFMREQKANLAEVVALESGKPKKHALGEIDAAAECGLYLCNQLDQFSPESLASSLPNREIKMIRQAIGIGALITPFNNPAAGIAWKTFPALLCGNAVVIKSHELTPYAAVWFGKILKEAGLPAGIFNVVQGFGAETGQPLVEDQRIKFVSFTGSLRTGRLILKATAHRLAKASIEAGGKNPFIVCDDADLEKAVSAAIAGSFVDAGQRCAATSRIIIMAGVYDEFKKLFLQKTPVLKVGVADSDDYGAIISQERMENIMDDVQGAVDRGAVLLTGGQRLGGQGYFLTPAVLENISPDDEFSQNEIFGPVATLYRAKDFQEALKLANNSKFKLSSAIHTQNSERAEEFIKKHLTGVVRVNGPTHGSEPHVPFGGVGLSGNGWREPGVKALDFYSDWKQISFDK